ncbi:MAG: hypothetical protein EHM21_17490 [Chloroflexi bacterium]|nr:MAG: hypothetical protein EHM21_17490 [Chloroflexota bacterium]
MVAMIQNQSGAAQEYLDQAAAFIAEKGMQNYIPLLELTQGQLRRRQDDPRQALEHLDRAVALAESNDLRPILWQAHAEAALALRALSQAPAADERLRQAQAVIAEIAGLFKNESYRQVFLANTTRQLELAE